MKGRDLKVGDVIVLDGMPQVVEALRERDGSRMVMTDKDYRVIVGDDDEVDQGT